MLMMMMMTKEEEEENKTKKNKKKKNKNKKKKKKTGRVAKHASVAVTSLTPLVSLLRQLGVGLLVACSLLFFF